MIIRHAVAGDEQPALRADHGLRRRRRARREDQRPDRVDVGLEAGVVGRHRRERVVERRAERRRRIVGSANRLDTSTGGSSPAIGASSASWRGSVITSPQSVCSMSRSRCSPRRVWLRPTTAAPASAGAAEREEVLGRVVEQHRDVRRPARAAAGRGRGCAHRHDSATYSRASTCGRRTGSRARRRTRSRCGAAARPRSARGAAPGRARGADGSANLTSASLYDGRLAAARAPGWPRSSRR